MHKISTSGLPDDVSEALERVSAEGGVILVEHEGRPVAALVTAEYFEEWREAATALDPSGGCSVYQWQAPHASDCETCRLYEESERIAGIGCWLWDEIADCMLFCSDQLARIVGMTAEAHIARTRSTALKFPWVHPEDRPHYLEKARQFTAEPSVLEIEYRLLRGDGAIAEVHEVWTPILDEAGTLVRSMGYVQSSPGERGRRAELRRIKRLYEDTARIARIGHWEWDPVEDRCTYCSPQHARIFGLTVEAFLQRARSIGGYMSLIHPDDRLHYQRSIQRYRRERTQTEIEHRIVRDDGTVVPVLVSIHPTLDADGRLVRTYGILQDISALRQSEESRQRSEAFLRQAGRVARFGTWIWDDVDDRLVYGSAELAEILELSPERLLEIGSSWSSYLARVHPDDRPAYEAETWQAAETCRPYDVVYRVRTGSGGYRYVREIGEPVFDKRGHHLRTLGSLQDVDDSIRAERAVGDAREELHRRIHDGIERLSAAKRALQAEVAARERVEAALRESEAGLRAIVEQSQSAIFMKDRKGRFRWVNARFLEWYGLTPDRVIGKASQEISTSSRISTYAQLNERVLQTGGVLEHELEVPFADGRLRPIHIVKFPVRGDDGETIGIGTIQTQVAR